MANTSGNDVNILQGTDSATVGAGAGNDRYVLDASTLTANQKITISDTQGTNVLQLVGGLQIVSSKVSSDAVQLTLNNGAVITVLGASTFSFQTGGNAINGTGGLTQNFSEFATTSLGVAVPVAGQAPATGAAVQVQEAGGTTASPVNPNPEVPATFTLTAADSVTEGASNTFTITASKAVTEATTVTFKLIPGNGTAVDQGTETTNLNDFGAGAFNAVTKTIAAGQTSVTFDVSALADSITELTETYSVEVKIGNQTFTKVVNLLDGELGAGKTFMLTKAQDNVPGTSGNDTIIGTLGTSEDMRTFSVLDIINGGAGTDTLKVSSESGDIVVGANVTGVEIVEATLALGGLTVNTTGSADVQTLKLVSGVGHVTATAAATTDIVAKLDSKSVNMVTTNGGKNVNVEVVNAASTVDQVVVGSSSTAAKGDVSVSVTGQAHVASTAAVTTNLGSIAVTGGKTISVTQKATSDAAAAVTSKFANTVNQGAIAATADASTTSITVKQDAAVAGKTAQDTTGGITEAVSVKFGALKATDSVTVGGLIFTAKVDLTAAEVAAAFANLADGKVPTAGSDTQAAGLAAKGTYAGTFDASPATGFSSAVAAGDTVVFTSLRPNYDAAALTVTGTTTQTGSVAPVATVTAGKPHNATPTGGVLGVNAGLVTIVGAAALKTVTVDGFGTTGSGSSTVFSSIDNGATSLETLNLSNGASTFTVGAAAETLTVALNNFGIAKVNATLTTDGVAATGATLDLNSTGTKTLNVSVDGKSNATVDIVGATAVNALNLSGTAAATVTTGGSNVLSTVKVSGAAGLTLNTAAGTLTSVDTTATTGNTAVTIDGSKATYAGGAGVDQVSVSTGATLNKSINLGAGNDKLDLSNAALTSTILKAIPTANLYQGGEGTDTIKLSAANAVELSKDGTFAGKIDGFEKLELTAATAVGTVDLSNLDGINYVITGGNALVPSAAVDESGVVTFQALTAGQSVTVANRTVTVSAGTGATAADIAAAYLSNTNTATLTVSGSLAGWTANSTSSTGALKFTSTTPATNVADLSTLISDTYLAAAATVATGTKYDGVPGTGERTEWTMQGLTNGQSYTLAGLTITANKTLTANEVAAAFANGTSVSGQYTVSGALDITTAGWVSPTVSAAGALLTVTNGASSDVTDFVTAPTSNATGASPTDAAVSSVDQGAAEGAGGSSIALTIDKLASGGTVEFTSAGSGAIVNVTNAAAGTADVLNVAVNAAVDVGTVKAANVETINISVANKTPADAFTTAYTGGPKVASAASDSTLTLDADAAKAVAITGAGNLTLNLATTVTKLAAVDASAATGKLTLDLSSYNGVAMTVTGGAGNDVLSASVGTGAKADVLVGGAGNDTLKAGSNGAKLTGGEGNDLFVLTTAGTKEANTYTSITDFQAGDVLQIQGLTATAAAFAKLTANLNENTSVFANFVDAAIAQAGVNNAVWFQFKGNAYVVVDQAGADGATFVNGQDTVIELVGVDLNNASFNSGSGTVALV